MIPRSTAAASASEPGAKSIWIFRPASPASKTCKRTGDWRSLTPSPGVSTINTVDFHPSDSCNSRSNPAFNCSARRTKDARSSRVPPNAVNWRESLTVRFSGLSNSGATTCAPAGRHADKTTTAARSAAFTAADRTSEE